MQISMCISYGIHGDVCEFYDDPCGFDVDLCYVHVDSMLYAYTHQSDLTTHHTTVIARHAITSGYNHVSVYWLHMFMFIYMIFQPILPASSCRLTHLISHDCQIICISKLTWMMLCIICQLGLQSSDWFRHRPTSKWSFYNYLNPLEPSLLPP